MTRNKKIIIGGLALAALTAGGLAASAARGGFGHGGHFGMGGGKGGMMGAICKGDASEMADLMLVRLEYKVKPTDAQKPAFDELKAAAKSAAVKAKAGCPAKPAQAADGARPAPKSPTERLALMETALAAQLDAVRTVRPAADKFYATLSEDQKKAFAVEHRGPGGWGRGEDGERGGRGHHGRGMHRGEGDRGGEPGAMTPQPAPDKR